MMRKLLIRLVLLLFVTSSFAAVEAQKSSRITTIILLRHAEKEIIEGNNDPPLSAAGIERASRLQATFPALVPDLFYSTPYIRTRETLKPWAAALHKEIQTYDAAKLTEFSEELLKQKGKTIVVAGHTNTIPPLVNLLIGKEKYKDLRDDEYGTIYVVTKKNGTVKEKIVNY
jgi:2,3-bisphosphoglycerate-dependent phosphoglycerate mutase